MTETPAMQAARRIFRPTNDQAVEQVAELIEALQLFLDDYIASVNSGDWGNWDPETEETVIRARAAIAKAAR